jgi:LL-H family phage holin
MTTSEWLQLAAIVLPIILPPLISLCVVWYKNMVQKLPQQKRDIVDQVVRTVVYAVEQKLDDTASNPQKKQEAVTLVKQILASLHISATDEMIDAVIEAAVFTMNQEKQASVVVEQRSPVVSAQPASA